MRTHSLKALAILVCLLLLPAALVIGGGQQEASLSDVQRLMDQLDYPGALKPWRRSSANTPINATTHSASSR